MKDIISASRRTDLPRWYLSQTIQCFKDGLITLPNPLYKDTTYTIDLKPENVACVVWWSKDYSEWIKACQADPEFFGKYHHYFQFTLNGYSDPDIQKLLERGVATSFTDRLQQLRTLAHLYSPEAINWRFDPITFWDNDVGIAQNNMGDFVTIAKYASEIGIKRCTIAFAEWSYRKAVNRAKSRRPDKKLIFYEVSLEQRKEDAVRLGKICQSFGMKLYSCAHHDIVDNQYVFPSSCIDGSVIGNLYNDAVSVAKDPSQREMCGCTKSRDIGDYAQKCPHSCIYCYANGV